MANGIFWSIGVMAFLMAYSIGANDAANALGTSYGSNAAKLWILLTIGAVCEFVGAVFCSSFIAGTLVDEMLPAIVTTPDDVASRMMLGVSIAAFSFILVASVFGAPISGTHTVIGALIGAGLAGVPASTINWSKFGFTVLSWFISPIIASFLAFMLFIAICACSLGGHIRSPQARLVILTLMYGFTCMFSVFMIIVLTNRNNNTNAYYSLIFAYALGVLLCRAILIHKAQPQSTLKHKAVVTISFW